MEKEIITNLILDIIRCLKDKGKILVYGNGGCASLADHLVTELVGRFKTNREPLAAISLCSSGALITCIANDFGFERIFSRQIDALADEKDVVIGLTTSAKSKNIKEALFSCVCKGCHSWLIAGSEIPSDTNELCDNIVKIPSQDSAKIQNFMLELIHDLSDVVDKEFISTLETSAFDKAISMSSDFDTLFLDRDGVVNTLVPNGYVLRPQEFFLTEAIKKKAASLARRFSKIIVVTNQKCVPKGIIDIPQLDSIHTAMIEEINRLGGRIDAIFSATSSALEMYKPDTGLIESVKQKFPDIDLSKVIMIGDAYSDYLFSKRIGAKYISI